MNTFKDHMKNTGFRSVNSIVKLALLMAIVIQTDFVIAAKADAPAVSGKENWVPVSEAFTKQIGVQDIEPAYLRRCIGMVVTPDGDIVIQTAIDGICVSRDQGATWSVVADNNIKGRGEGFSMPYPYDGRMAFFAYDGAGGKAGGMSLDDAKTWKPFAQINRGVVFGDVDWNTRDPQIIFGLTHEPYFSVLSTDGGKSWRQINSAETGSGPESNYCLGVLDGKTLLRGNPNEDIIESSNDAGGTWSQVTNYRTLTREAVHYGRNVYWATANGVVVTSNGKDWNLTGTGAEGACFGPYFGSSEQEFVVVTEKNFLKTEDGGKTWNPIAKFFMAPGVFRNLKEVCYFGWDSKHNILYASGCGASVYQLKL
jgi:hypothetical protein